PVETYGILYAGQEVSTIDSNLIGGMDMTPGGTYTSSASSSYPRIFAPIGVVPYNTSTTTNVVTVSGNTIGGTVAHSLRNLSNDGSSRLHGIMAGSTYSGYYAPLHASGNIIRNLTTSNASYGGSSEMYATLNGIWTYQAAPAHTITGNRISKLSSEGTGNVYVNGIYLYTTASTGTVVEGNTIDSLSVAGTGHITGLYYRTGTGTGNILRGNTVHALYSGSGSPTMYGIQLGAGSAAVDSNLVQGVA